jgi:hypothetical protein
VLDVEVAADPPPDGDGIELLLSGAVPELSAVTAGDEGRRVAALGGAIEAGGNERIVVHVPGERRTSGLPAVGAATS